MKRPALKKRCSGTDCTSGGVYPPCDLAGCVEGAKFPSAIEQELASLKVEVARLARALRAAGRRPRYHEKCGFCGGSGYVDKHGR